MQDPFDWNSGPEPACCFTGHRPESLPDRGNEEKRGMIELASLLESAVLRAYQGGISLFFAGGARGFDTLAAETVLRLGANDSRVRLCLALPGRDQASGWPAGDRLRYEAVLASAASVWYAADRCSPDSMRKRDRRLVDQSTKCVAYLRRMRGGTLYTVRYALERGVPVENLAMRTPNP